jgi:hypothetical protein
MPGMQSESRTSSSMCCYRVRRSGVVSSSRPFALGTAFTHLESMALSAGSRQTGNSDCVAPKRISLYWRWKGRAGKCGRPCVSRETRELIRQMSKANPYGEHRGYIGELLKLGIEVSQATVAKYMSRQGSRLRRLGARFWKTIFSR